MTKSMTDLFQPVTIEIKDNEEGRPYLSIDGSRTWILNGGDTNHITQNAVSALNFLILESKKYATALETLKEKLLDLLKKKQPVQAGDMSLALSARATSSCSYKDIATEYMRKAGMTDQEIEDEFKRRTVKGSKPTLCLNGHLV